MELQMRMDLSWRKLRSYSGMANTQRKHALQLPTLGGRPSSLDICSLPITIRKLTGLTRVSPCLNALLSVKGSQMEAWWMSQLATGCLTCHTSHGCMTHFRPLLGNLVEVTLMPSPFMYIVSHTTGTSFP